MSDSQHLGTGPDGQRLTWLKLSVPEELLLFVELKPEARGLYATARAVCWLEGGLPADPAALARKLRVTPSVLARSWPAIAEHFSPAEPGRIVMTSLLPLTEAARRLIENKSKAGKASALARANASASEGSNPTPVEHTSTRVEHVSTVGKGSEGKGSEGQSRVGEGSDRKGAKEGEGLSVADAGASAVPEWATRLARHLSRVAPTSPTEVWAALGGWLTAHSVDPAQLEAAGGIFERQAATAEREGTALPSVKQFLQAPGPWVAHATDGRRTRWKSLGKPEAGAA